MLVSKNPKRKIAVDSYRQTSDVETAFVISEGAYHYARTYSNEALAMWPDRVLEDLELRLDRFIRAQASGAHEVVCRTSDGLNL